MSLRGGEDNEYGCGQRRGTAEGNVEWKRPNRAKREGSHENSVSGLFSKEDHEWIKWIQDGKHIRIDQKKIRSNPSLAVYGLIPLSLQESD